LGLQLVVDSSEVAFEHLPVVNVLLVVFLHVVLPLLMDLDVLVHDDDSFPLFFDGLVGK
jgi:hypothetical protein